MRWRPERKILTWRRWQLSPPTVGLTCDDHRQPGSSVSRSGSWDGAVLQDELLAPGGDVARQAKADGRLRTEELSARNMGLAFGHARHETMHAPLSSRPGCDDVRGAVDLAALCLRER